VFNKLQFFKLQFVDRGDPTEKTRQEGLIMSADANQNKPSLKERLRKEEMLGQEMSANYPGRWVAIEDHKVVADAESYDALMLQLFSCETVEIRWATDDPTAHRLYAIAA
jgi:hypothetical protein